MSIEILIGEVKKNQSEIIRVSLTEYNGHNLVALRVWFDKDGELRPSKKGLTVNIKKLNEIRALLDSAALEARKIGWEE